MRAQISPSNSKVLCSRNTVLLIYIESFLHGLRYKYGVSEQNADIPKIYNLAYSNPELA